VIIVSKDPGDGNPVEHCIKWDENTEPRVIGKAIEDILAKVKISSPEKSTISS
jgi:hypothetical protein